MSGALSVQRAGQRARNELHLADRCDHARCADRAVVVTRHSGLPLGHCRVHFEVSAQQLGTSVVVDVRRTRLDVLDLPQVTPVPEPTPAGRDVALLQRARLRLGRLVLGPSASPAAGESLRR